MMLGDDYFRYYNEVEVHRLMLSDRPRLEAYKTAIFGSRSKIEGKVVLDVGSGSGILAIFCAQAGAKKVHAVEATEIAKLSMNVIHENNLNDVIEVHHCLVKDLQLPEQVDVIVSEWMGFYLFHEGMLSAVIDARDRFLKPDGFIIPESADLYVAPCQLPKFFDFWDNVHGVKMGSLGKYQRETHKEPIIKIIPEHDIISEHTVVKSVILKTVKEEDVKHIEFKTIVAASKDAKYQGICMWFVVHFALDNDEITFLTTAPGEPDTHWKQTSVLYPVEMNVEEGDPIAFHVVLRSQDDDPRKYHIEVNMLDPDNEEHPTPCQCRMTRCVIIRKYLEDRMQEENENVFEESDDDDEDH